MNYASIREMDISNGESIGVALFVQGCHFHCHNCFNQETWDFNGGNEWNDEIKDKFLELINRPYIKRITILGGEPLANESVENILDLVSEIRVLFPDKSIWIYTGYTFEEIQLLSKGLDQESMRFNKYNKMRQNILENCDVLVDGRSVGPVSSYTFRDVQRNHTIHAVFSADPDVQPPATGDSPALMLLLSAGILLAAGMLVLLTLRRKSR